VSHPDTAVARAQSFCADYELRIPVLMAPMAGACPPSLAIAVGNAGGMGACGALPLQPEAIEAWVSEVRSATNGAFQLNTWVPDPAPARDAAQEAAVREFLRQWGPVVSVDAASHPLIDFSVQCNAMLAAGHFFHHGCVSRRFCCPLSRRVSVLWDSGCIKPRKAVAGAFEPQPRHEFISWHIQVESGPACRAMALYQFFQAKSGCGRVAHFFQ